MKKRKFIRILTILLVVAMVACAARVVLGAPSTDIPVAYVISDGTDCYYIDFDELVASYMEYVDDTSAPGAKLAKFYFDKLEEDIMTSFKSYVSGVTTKFVSFGEVINKYIETEDVDATYIWFNSLDATPAFSVITKVWVLDANAEVAGRYYVDTDGYIIRYSDYTMDTDLPANANIGSAAEFSLTVEGNDIGIESFTGILSYEITGGGYTLEYNNGSTWEELTGGTIFSEMVTPDWNMTKNLRFTANESGTYSVTFKLSTGGGVVMAEKTQNVEIASNLQLDADVPTFRLGETAEFTLTTTANSDAGKLARAYFTLPSGAMLEYKDSSDNWVVLTDVYGPEEGFVVTDETIQFRVTFTEAGTKTIGVQFKEVGTDVVLASSDITAVVEQPMTIRTELSEFYVGEPTEFTLTTTANDDAGKMVNAHFTIPAGATLEYQEEGTGTWVPLTDVLGGSSGFEMSDATHTFRATFTDEGTKVIGVRFVEVGTGVELVEQDIIAAVAIRVIPMTSFPGLKYIMIDADTVNVTVDLNNPVENVCNMKISLVLEGEEVLYTSSLLSPGEAISNIMLTRPLGSGQYAAIIRYEAFDSATSAKLNSADVRITLSAD